MFGTYTTLISVSILNRLFSCHSSARTKSDKARTSELTASILLWRPYTGMVWNLQNSSLTMGRFHWVLLTALSTTAGKRVLIYSPPSHSPLKIPISRSIISFRVGLRAKLNLLTLQTPNCSSHACQSPAPHVAASQHALLFKAGTPNHSRLSRGPQQRDSGTSHATHLSAVLTGYQA